VVQSSTNEKSHRISVAEMLAEKVAPVIRKRKKRLIVLKEIDRKRRDKGNHPPREEEKEEEEEKEMKAGKKIRGRHENRADRQIRFPAQERRNSLSLSLYLCL
jgi:hypothetical protein